MWNSISGFVRRHKRKFFVLGGVVGGVYVFRRILISKLSEWETRQTQDFLDQMKRYHHFEGTLQTCDSTILSFIPKIRESVQSILKVDELIDKLKNNPQKKLEVWEELKILIFCETIGEICGEVLLVIFLRVQLSIIGGYMYLDIQNQTKKLGTPDHLNITLSSCSQEVQQRYLGCINHFFNSGMQDFILVIRDTLKESLSHLSLKDRLVVSDFQPILANVKKSILSEKNGICKNISSFLLPDGALEIGALTANSNIETSTTIFHKMLLETRDVLETADFKNILNEGIDHGFVTIFDRISESMMHVNQGEFVNPHQVAVPLAKILPAIHSQFKIRNTCSNNGTKSSLLQQLLQGEKSKTFAANIYEAFSQPLDIDQNIRPSISDSSLQ